MATYPDGVKKVFFPTEDWVFPKITDSDEHQMATYPDGDKKVFFPTGDWVFPKTARQGFDPKERVWKWKTVWRQRESEEKYSEGHRFFPQGQIGEGEN